MLSRRLVAALALALACALTAGPSPATAATSATSYAPVTRPGPKLSVPSTTMRAAMECHGDPTKGPRPILLNAGTSVTPDENFSWNWEKVFNAQGRYWCTMTMPFHTFGDIQVAAEYLVYAIRLMNARTGRKIAILGHSQGGMSPRWALRFWPDVRPKVAELIGMAPSNHGTLSVLGCIPGVTTCVPAVWQQKAGSNFTKALNSSRETFYGIDYTNIYTNFDEVVTPPPSSALTTGRGRIANIELHTVCPTDPHEHVTMGTISPATYGIVMDALTHDGPAVASRVDKALCNRLYMPGVDPADVEDNLKPLLAAPSLLSTVIPIVTFSGAPMTTREPALRCYVYAAGC